jgi:HSP20 family protein
MANITMWDPWRASPWFSNLIEDDLGVLEYTGNEIDMYEKNDNLFVEVKAPGFSKEDLSVSVENGILNVKGELSEDKKKDEENRNYIQREIRRRMFIRKVNLPVSVEADKSQAEFKDGILKVKFPKSEMSKTRNIKISS